MEHEHVKKFVINSIILSSVLPVGFSGKVPTSFLFPLFTLSAKINSKSCPTFFFHRQTRGITLTNSHFFYGCCNAHVVFLFLPVTLQIILIWSPHRMKKWLIISDLSDVKYFIISHHSVHSSSNLPFYPLYSQVCWLLDVCLSVIFNLKLINYFWILTAN